MGSSYWHASLAAASAVSPRDAKTLAVGAAVPLEAPATRFAERARLDSGTNTGASARSVNVDARIGTSLCAAFTVASALLTACSGGGGDGSVASGCGGGVAPEGVGVGFGLEFALVFVFKVGSRLRIGVRIRVLVGVGFRVRVGVRIRVG